METRVGNSWEPITSDPPKMAYPERFQVHWELSAVPPREWVVAFNSCPLKLVGKSGYPSTRPLLGVGSRTVVWSVGASENYGDAKKNVAKAVAHANKTYAAHISEDGEAARTRDAVAAEAEARRLSEQEKLDKA